MRPEDHPLRYALANELHARPFPVIDVPGRAVLLALADPGDPARRDRAAERDHLIALLDRYGAPHPQPGATHYSGRIGKHGLKWESHTEFVTYSVFLEGLGERPFDPADFAVFPEDWLAASGAVRLTSAMVRIEPYEDAGTVQAKADDWFEAESLAINEVLEGAGVIAGDFRIDPAGHQRFAYFAAPGTGVRRNGRIVQRICEIELYKTMSLLGLATARELAGPIAEIEQHLSDLVADMSAETAGPEDTLKALLAVAAELEQFQARSSFRFAATRAYEALVNQRIAALRETRIEGRQSFAEFMARRYDPAMRTVQAAEKRLQGMTDRALRAGELLRTRVDVERSATSEALLASMDRRADLQLHLQKTVEGLSVVAISYYAVSLAGYLLAPVAHLAGLEKAAVTAIATPLVVIAVWLIIRRIRRGVG